MSVHPWGRPCLVEECKEKLTPTACTLFKNKCPEQRLAIVRKRELCTLCFRHLDTNRCWSLGKVASRGIRGCMMAHCSLFHDLLQDEKVMMESASQRMGGGAESALRCRQVVAMENGGQCFRIVVQYDWGATASMVTREAATPWASPLKAGQEGDQRPWRCDCLGKKYLCSSPCGQKW